MISTVSPNQLTDSNTLTFQKCMGYNASGVILGNTINYTLGGTGTSNDPYRIRRTENWQVEILTDSATSTGLIFNRDASSTPNNDVWVIQVQLEKSNFTGNYLEAYSTMVQLKL